MEQSNIKEWWLDQYKDLTTDELTARHSDMIKSVKSSYPKDEIDEIKLHITAIRRILVSRKGQFDD